MTCPLCSGEVSRVIYYGLPHWLCNDRGCSCLFGWAEPFTKFLPFNGWFYGFEGSYWPALWEWLHADPPDTADGTLSGHPRAILALGISIVALALVLAGTSRGQEAEPEPEVHELTIVDVPCVGKVEILIGTNAVASSGSAISASGDAVPECPVSCPSLCDWADVTGDGEIDLEDVAAVNASDDVLHARALGALVDIYRGKKCLGVR